MQNSTFNLSRSSTPEVGGGEGSSSMNPSTSNCSLVSLKSDTSFNKSSSARRRSYQEATHHTHTNHRQQQENNSRMSWAISDWEDLGRSISNNDYDHDECSNDECDLDDSLSDSLAWLFLDCPNASCSSSNMNKSSRSEMHTDVARPGSLLELILQEDSPIISGCDAPEMRRRGSMQERKDMVQSFKFTS